MELNGIKVDGLSFDGNALTVDLNCGVEEVSALDGRSLEASDHGAPVYVYRGFRLASAEPSDFGTLAVFVKDSDASIANLQAVLEALLTGEVA